MSNEWIDLANEMKAKLLGLLRAALKLGVEMPPTIHAAFDTLGTGKRPAQVGPKYMIGNGELLPVGTSAADNLSAVQSDTSASSKSS